MTELGTAAGRVSVALPGRPDSAIELAWGAATDVGRRRAANEDSYLAHPPVFAVADGMGGHASGDLASAAVVARLDEARTGDFVAPDAVSRALAAATDDIALVADVRGQGVGTTATGVVLTLQSGEPYFAVFNVGDSRVYQFERNELSQVTVDHSVVQELVDAGMLAAEDAEHHPDSNVITRAVGFGEPPNPDFWLIAMRAGFRLLVCSDGLTKEVSDERLRLHLAAGLSPSETVGALVDAALASGGRDNVTLIVVDVLSMPREFDLEKTTPRSGARTRNRG